MLGTEPCVLCSDADMLPRRPQDGEKRRSPDQVPQYASEIFDQHMDLIFRPGAGGWLWKGLLVVEVSSMLKSNVERQPATAGAGCAKTKALFVDLLIFTSHAPCRGDRQTTSLNAVFYCHCQRNLHNSPDNAQHGLQPANEHGTEPAAGQSAETAQRAGRGCVYDTGMDTDVAETGKTGAQC